MEQFLIKLFLSLPLKSPSLLRAVEVLGMCGLGGIKQKYLISFAQSPYTPPAHLSPRYGVVPGNLPLSLPPSLPLAFSLCLCLCLCLPLSLPPSLSLSLSLARSLARSLAMQAHQSWSRAGGTALQHAQRHPEGRKRVRRGPEVDPLEKKETYKL